jgi:hypothetical protein
MTCIVTSCVASAIQFSCIAIVMIVKWPIGWIGYCLHSTILWVLEYVIRNLVMFSLDLVGNLGRHFDVLEFWNNKFWWSHSCNPSAGEVQSLSLGNIYTLSCLAQAKAGGYHRLVSKQTITALMMADLIILLHVDLATDLTGWNNSNPIVATLSECSYAFILSGAVGRLKQSFKRVKNTNIALGGAQLKA